MSKRTKKNAPLAGLETRLEPRLALSVTKVVVLDVFWHVVGRYDDGGGGVGCTVLVRDSEACLIINKH
jgi:hypothetical protein